MGRKQTKQTTRKHRLRPSRAQSRKVRQSGWRRVGMILLFLALAGGVLLALAPGTLEVSLRFLTVTFLVLGILALLVVFVWIGLIFRRHPEEQRWQEEQRQELVRMEQTASAVGVRPIALADLAYLGDIEFEHFTVALLTAMGVALELERVGGAGDHGIDLRGKTQYGNLFIGQCKRYFGKKPWIRPDKMREFRGTRQLHGALEAWFVTTAFFTSQAKDEVASLVDQGYIKLVDGDQLIEFIQMFWNTLPAEWQWRLTECMVQHDQGR